MPPVGFEHTISAGERPQTYTLDRAATGTGSDNVYHFYSLIYLLAVYVTPLSPGADLLRC